MVWRGQWGSQVRELERGIQLRGGSPGTEGLASPGAKQRAEARLIEPVELGSASR